MTWYFQDYAPSGFPGFNGGDGGPGRPGVGFAGGKGSVTLKARFNYVALGDSYSSGTAVGYYESGAAAPCLRSSKAYPRVLERNFPAQIKMADVQTPAGTRSAMQACHGAEIPDVRDQPQFVGIDRQIDAVTSAAGLVTISIGGNDLGFAPKLRECIYNGCSGAPLVTVDELVRVEDQLVLLYKTIKSKMMANGKLVVVNYPLIFPTGTFDPTKCPLSAGKLKPADMSNIINAWTLTNAMLAGAVQATGDPNIVLLDVSDTLRGHDMCSSSPWTNGVFIDVPNGGDTSQSFHPNESGHAAVAFALTALLQQIGVL